MCQKTSALALLVFAVTACDPCGVTLNCTGAPRVGVVGQIVDDSTGESVGNVTVTMQRMSGVPLDPSSATTRSGSDGIFELDLGAETLGDAVVSVTVAAPGRPSYVVPDIRLSSTTQTGHAKVFPPWAAGRPHFPFVLIVYRDLAAENGVDGAIVEFRRTAGPQLFWGDLPVNVVQSTADAMGWVYLFRDIRADRAGIVTGDLSITAPGGGTLTLPQVTWQTTPRFKQPTLPVVVVVGSL